MSRLRLYDYAASANCYKVRLALAQLGVDYERVSVDIFDGDTLTSEFGLMNPARSTPVLAVGADHHLPESNAILAYLAEGTPLSASDRFLRAQVVRWLLFEQTDVMGTIGGLRFRLVTGRLQASDPAAQRRHAAACAALELLDGHLTDQDFLAGDYSIADIAVYAYTHVAPDAGIELDRYPSVRRWLARVEATPGFINDLAPYPPNASETAGRSIYG